MLASRLGSGVGFVACQSTLSSMATRRSLTYQDTTELLENQTLTHIHWKMTFLLGDSDTVSANCWPVVPVVHRFTGGPSWLQKTEPPLPHLAFDH
jgi:hypothetical protein